MGLSPPPCPATSYIPGDEAAPILAAGGQTQAGRGMVTHPAGCPNTGSGLFISPIHTIPKQHRPFDHCLSTSHGNQQPGETQGTEGCPTMLERPKVCGMTTPGPCVEGPHLTQHHSLSQRMAFSALQWGWPPPGQEKWCWKQLQTLPLPNQVVVQSSLQPSAGTEGV